MSRTWWAYRRFPSLRIATLVFVAVLLAGSVGPFEGTIARAPGTRSSGVAPPTTEALPRVHRRFASEVDGLVVTSVKDGDTLILSDGQEVRLPQVDAPERGDCFYAESTGALTKLALGKKVSLQRPPTAPQRDRYGRTLADVLVSGKSVSETLLRQGGAGFHERYTHEDPALARLLSRAEADARAAGRGIWNACSYGSGQIGR